MGKDVGLKQVIGVVGFDHQAAGSTFRTDTSDSFFFPAHVDQHLFWQWSERSHNLKAYFLKVILRRDGAATEHRSLRMKSTLHMASYSSIRRTVCSAMPCGGRIFKVFSSRTRSRPSLRTCFRRSWSRPRNSR